MYEIQHFHYDSKTNTVIIHLNPDITEFSSELDGTNLDLTKKENLRAFIKKTVSSRMKGTGVKTVKVMLGT